MCTYLSNCSFSKATKFREIRPKLNEKAQSVAQKSTNQTTATSQLHDEPVKCNFWKADPSLFKSNGLKTAALVNYIIPKIQADKYTFLIYTLLLIHAYLDKLRYWEKLQPQKSIFVRTLHLMMMMQKNNEVLCHSSASLNLDGD